MSQEKDVSVIVCTYNRAEHLSRVIGLLRKQDYKQGKFEIVIVDNGSTDNTKRVTELLMKEPGVKIRYALESRRGVSFARNRGLDEAVYPYLAYIDDDCTVGPEWLTSLMSGFDLDNRIFAVFGQVINGWGDQAKPDWMIPATEAWLGNNSFLGNSPRILEDSHGTREGNLSIKKEKLRSFGGFLGMEQFGSRNMASGELKYCLVHAKKYGAKFAYVPSAIVHHQIVPRSRPWMIKRAYWQGITDGLYDFLLFRRKFWETLFRTYVDIGALIFLLGQSLSLMILFNQPKSLFHLLRAVRRFSLILCELHLTGNWTQLFDWMRKHPSR